MGIGLLTVYIPKDILKNLIEEKMFNITFNLDTDKYQEDVLDNIFSYGTIIKKSLSKKVLLVYKCATKSKEFQSFITTNERGYKNVNMKDINNYLKNYHSKFTDSKNKEYSYFSQYGLINYTCNKFKYYTQFGINSKMLSALSNEVWNAWAKKLTPKTLLNTRINTELECNRLTWSTTKGIFIGANIDIDNSTISIKTNNKVGKNAKYLNLKFNYNHKKPYEVFAFNNEIKQFSIIKKQSHGKVKYYVQFTIDAEPYMKERKLGNGSVGIDMNMNNIAIVYDNGCSIDKLCDKVEYYTEEIAKLQQKMDGSRRASNPDNYNPDGTIKRGVKLNWVYSNRYYKYKSQLNELMRKQKDIRKTWTINEANSLLNLGDTFKVEDMNYAALAKKSTGETTINQTTGKCNSKKRFGKSIGKYAPSELINTLERKVNLLGGNLHKIDCKNAATQLDPTNGNFNKHTLSERQVKLSNGNVHSRDLVSALNIKFNNCTTVKDYNFTELKKFYYDKFIDFEKTEINKHNNNLKNTVHSMGM